ncbi:MAG TPA: hypothetical protein VG826_34530 [Pirellulales bacterium]|nr:hypothetical protein [Pirellulales bacterium]
MNCCKESILKAFEEEGQQNGGRWPTTIDDPISGPTPDPIKRLHNALNLLNAAIAEGAAQATAPYSIKFTTTEPARESAGERFGSARPAWRKRAGRPGRGRRLD